MPIAIDRINQYIDVWLNECLKVNRLRLQEYTLELIRTADFHCILINSPLRGHPEKDSRLILEGLELMLSRFLPAIEIEDSPFNNSTSNQELTDIVEMDLAKAGRLSRIRYLAGFEEKDNLVFSEEVATNHIAIHLNSNFFAHLERNDEDWMIYDDRKSTNKLREEIDLSLTRALEKPYFEYAVVENREIRYKKFNNELFDACKKWQNVSVNEYLDSHAVPDDATIGNRTFAEWKNLASTAAAILFMRRLYATRLAFEEGASDLTRKDFLTTVIPLADQNLIWRKSEDSEGEEALSGLIDAFFLDAETAKSLHGKRDITSPYGIRVKDKLILAHFGYTGNMCSFMTGYLKKNFEKDWFKAVNQREKVFQNLLEKLFKSKGYIVGKSNVDVKTDIGNTDTDGALYEPAKNCVYIFQLKYPGTWTYNHDERWSSQENLRESCNTWISKLKRWIKIIPKEEILMRLNLLKEVADLDNLEIRLFVLSKLDVRYDSKDDQYDRDAAWASWHLLRRIVSQSAHAESSLDYAWQACRKPIPPFKPMGEVTPYPFDSLLIDVHK